MNIESSSSLAVVPYQNEAKNLKVVNRESNLFQVMQRATLDLAALNAQVKEQTMQQKQLMVASANARDQLFTEQLDNIDRIKKEERQVLQGHHEWKQGLLSDAQDKLTCIQANHEALTKEQTRLQAELKALKG